MKSLNGQELADYIKERQFKAVKPHFPRPAKLLILKDSDNPVIEKYVELKREYGEEIGVLVEIKTVATDEMTDAIEKANKDETIDGMIVQLPLLDTKKTDDILSKIAPDKDVDGLIGEKSDFQSATAEAIVWLLNGYNIELKGKKIAIVGRGRLVGKPLERILGSQNLDFTVFTSKDSDRLLTLLPEYDIIISATGVAGLIKRNMLKKGAVVVDAGTTSEDGVLMGDLDNKARDRSDLILTPKIGGVGPLTITVLFEHVLSAYRGRLG